MAVNHLRAGAELGAQRRSLGRAVETEVAHLLAFKQKRSLVRDNNNVFFHSLCLTLQRY